MIKKINFFFIRIWNIYTHSNLFIENLIKKKKLKKIRKLKIIFIKPYNYLDIYKKSFDKSILSILDSNYRMGPVGLFTDHDTRFVISNFYNGSKINFNSAKKNLSKTNLSVLKFQKNNCIDINKINFNNYDLAIFFENTISHNISKKYEKVLWFKIFEDHKNRSFKKNVLFKPKYFDGILNQTMGFTPYSLFRRLHSIDFSYTFGNSGFLKKIKKNFIKSIDIIFEVNQTALIKEYFNKLKNNNVHINIKKIYALDENLSHKSYISKLAKGKFFLAVSTKTPRWGNSLIEAAICQNLIIGNRNCFWNSQLIIKQLHCTNIEKALLLVNILKNDKKLHKAYLNKQNLLLNYINYTRPLKQIIDYSINCNRDLNIHKKLMYK